MKHLIFRLALPGILALAGTAAAQDRPLSPAPSVIDRFLSKTPGTVPLAKATGEMRAFTLEVHKSTGEIAPGVQVEQWAYSLPGQAPTVPSPQLRVKQGDRVRITLVNKHDQPHTIHLHGITSLAQEMDGVPHTSHLVMPGESYTYEFVATEAGTNAYHCHVQTNVHLDMGMYGALIVEPREDSARVWSREYTLILDEWDSRQDPNALKHQPNPNYFLVNGKAMPLADPIDIPSGEVALVRLVNLGNAPHSLHLHGNSFLILNKDTYPLATPQEADTLPILPGERYDVLIKGRDGTFPWHDHILTSNTNDGSYPGGMHFMVRGGPALRADGTPPPANAQHDAHATPAATSAPTPPAAPPEHPASSTAEPHGPAGAEGTSTAPQAGRVEIAIKEFQFEPGVLRVKRGTTVVWRNADPVAHAVTVEGPAGRSSGLLRKGGGFEYTFNEVGRFKYHCAPHNFMSGEIIVE